MLGLLGTNGIGKSTALNVMACKLKPNLGEVDEDPPGWEEIIKYYRGSSLQSYFTDLLMDNLVVAVKVGGDYWRGAQKQHPSTLNSKSCINLTSPTPPRHW